MERGRRFAGGRLSEVLGAKTLALDKFSLTIGYMRAAELTWQNSIDEAGQPDDRLTREDMA